MTAHRSYTRKRRAFGALLRIQRIRAGFRTQAQLAAAAGISSASEVSNAENGDVSEYVARTLVAAIQARYPLRLDEMQELATAFLFPDAPEHARGPTPSIGLMVASIDYSPFWSKFAGAAEREAAKYGHLLTVVQHFNDLDQQRNALNLLVRKRAIAGLLIAPAIGAREPTPDFERDAIGPLITLHRQGAPIVFIDRAHTIAMPFPCVRADHAFMVRAAVEELHRNGHRRIGAIFGARRALAYQEQHRGYVAALKEFAAFRDEQALRDWLGRWVAFGEEPGEARREIEIIQRGHTAGRDVAMRLLSQGGERPTALVCGTAALALETLAAIRALGRGGSGWEVPRDLSLIAAESAPSLRWGHPVITSVDYNLDTLARRAVAKLVALIANRDDPTARQDDPPLRTYEIVRGQSIRALGGEVRRGTIAGDS
jgi:LacI family transcriptional regulator, repressor for deo operon, udp, cdd, tsx, nupC, and nupG